MTAYTFRGEHHGQVTGAPTRLLMIGRPGAGKGTQASRVSEIFRIAHISTGELLRDAIARNGPVGRRCRGYVTAGRLVPTVLMGNLVRDVLVATDAIDGGFLLDGYPRTLGQLQILDDLLGPRELDAALELDVSSEQIMQRLAARSRQDDIPSALLRRLEEFDDDTRPMISSLEDRGLLVSVDGDRHEDEVTADLLASLASLAEIRSAGDSGAHHLTVT